MSIKIVSNDELKKQAEKIATENNISEEDFIKKCQALFSEITDDNLDDAQKERRVYRRFIGSLRKQASQDCEKFTGYVFAREKNKDFADIRRKKITEYLEDHSIEEAKEIKYVNDDGEYLYGEDDFYHKGEILPKETGKGKYYGIFMVNNQLEVHPVFLASFNLSSIIPMFTNVELCVKVGNEDSMFKTNTFLFNNCSVVEQPNMPLSYDDMVETESELRSVLDGKYNEIKFVDSYDEVIEYAEQKDLPRNNCLIIQGSVIAKNPIKDKNTGSYITLADNDVSDFSCWVNPEIRDSLPMFSETADVLAMISVYVKNDGEIGCNLLGLVPFEAVD